MGEFQYRGFRVRTVFEKDWRIKVWPPLQPMHLIEHVRASPAEGEPKCRQRATDAIDDAMRRADPQTIRH